MTLSSGVASWARGHVTPFLTSEKIFFRYTLKQVFGFGLVLCQTLTQRYLFSRIRFGMIP